MAALEGEWLEALKGEFRKPYYAKLYKKVLEEYQTRKIFLLHRRCLMRFILPL